MRFLFRSLFLTLSHTLSLSLSLFLLLSFCLSLAVSLCFPLALCIFGVSISFSLSFLFSLSHSCSLSRYRSVPALGPPPPFSAGLESLDGHELLQDEGGGGGDAEGYDDYVRSVLAFVEGEEAVKKHVGGKGGGGEDADIDRATRWLSILRYNQVCYFVNVFHRQGFRWRLLGALWHAAASTAFAPAHAARCSSLLQ